MTRPSLLALIFARTKRGKTTLFARAWSSGIFVGVRSAIELVTMGTCGFRPDWIQEDVTTLPELATFLKWLGDTGNAQARGAVYVDDFTLMCNKSMIVWDDQAPSNNGRKDRYWRFQQLDRYLDQVAYLFRALGVSGGLSCHEKLPGERDGVFTPGAPDVPSKSQLESMPAWCDLVARATVDDSYPDPWWPGVFQCDPRDPSWVTGDRTDTIVAATPANLREALRASSHRYDLRRLPGLEWQDEWAEAVCQRFLAGEAPSAIATDVFRAFGAYAQPGTPGEQHVRWAVQDGIARAVIRRQRQGGVLGRMRQALAVPGMAPPPAGSATPAPAPGAPPPKAST